MHKLHITAFAHRYTHHLTGKHFYAYHGPDDSEMVYFRHENDEVKKYVKAVNTLACLKKLYTLTSRNVLVVIHSLSGRMVRLATDPEDWGIAHTVKEEGLRVRALASAGDRWDYYNLHVGGMSTDAIDRLRRDLIGADKSVRTAHLERAAKVTFSPFSIPTINKLSDLMPSIVPVELRPSPEDFTDAFMESLKCIEQDTKKKREKEVARQIKDRIEKAIYQGEMPAMVAQIHMLDRAHAFDWAMQCVGSVLEKVVEEGVPLTLKK